jgi:mRNA interferase MazF
MRPIVICDWGDVVVVPFPFTDLPLSKHRPALVLSNNTFNRANQHSILAMITTAARSSWPSDIQIVDLAATGLPRRSLLRWKIFTLPNALIQKRLGKLATSDRATISASQTAILGRS